MEELRDLAWIKLLWPWLTAALDTKAEVRRTIEHALSNLSEGISLMQQMHQQGDGEFQENGGPLLEQAAACYSARAILDDARRQLSSLRTQQVSAAHVFVLYARLVGDCVRWRLKAFRAEAASHYAKALENLRSAASRSRATRCAFLVAQTFPPLSPGRISWLAAALKLAHSACRDANVALREASLSGRAVARQVFVAIEFLKKL